MGIFMGLKDLISISREEPHHIHDTHIDMEEDVFRNYCQRDVEVTAKMYAYINNPFDKDFCEVKLMGKAGFDLGFIDGKRTVYKRDWCDMMPYSYSQLLKDVPEIYNWFDIFVAFVESTNYKGLYTKAKFLRMSDFKFHEEVCKPLFMKEDFDHKTNEQKADWLWTRLIEEGKKWKKKGK